MGRCNPGGGRLRMVPPHNGVLRGTPERSRVPLEPIFDDHILHLARDRGECLLRWFEGHGWFEDSGSMSVGAFGCAKFGLDLGDDYCVMRYMYRRKAENTIRKGCLPSLSTARAKAVSLFSSSSTSFGFAKISLGGIKNTGATLDSAKDKKTKTLCNRLIC